MVLNFLQQIDISRVDCRGQPHDNASNMTGQYSGLQKKISGKSESVFFIPCAGRSFNLVGKSAAGSCLKAIFFFTFFNTSTTFFLLELIIGKCC